MSISVISPGRKCAPWLALAGAASAAMAWAGLYGYGWNDYDTEARAAVDALVQGHLRSFFELAPVYGGSLLERAPFALAPSLWGGGELAVYRMLALPCLLAAAALGLWLMVRLSARGAERLTRLVALGLCVANPLTLAALELGHPDELIGGVLCVAAVLLAARGHWSWAGLALGAAIANKQWAVLAIVPVLVALPGRRLACLTLAGALAGALMAPFALFGGASFTSNLRGAADPPSTIFQPWQLWWFFGHHGHVVRGIFGAIKPGYRTAPTWLGGLPHLLIPALAVPLGLPVLLRGRTLAAGWRASAGKRADGRRESDALLLLALLLLLRCMLDSWDVIYYPLPFVLALLAWETSVSVRPALLALTSAVAVWAGCRWLPGFASADAQAAFFAAWSLPLAAWLARALYLPDAALRHDRQLRRQTRQRLTVAVAEHH
jgi:Glycosyltransferase family 87